MGPNFGRYIFKAYSESNWIFDDDVSDSRNNNLYNARVGSISGSEGFDYLTKQGITVIPIGNYQEGLQAVASKKIDAFVQDEHILRLLVKSEFPGRVQVLPGTFDEYFVSIALQEKSPLRKQINKALLKVMQTQNWTEWKNRYLK